MSGAVVKRGICTQLHPVSTAEKGKALTFAFGIEKKVGADQPPTRPERLEDAPQIAQIIPQLDDGDEVEARDHPREDGDARIEPFALAELPDVPCREPQVASRRPGHPRFGDAGREHLAGSRLHSARHGAGSAARRATSAPLSSTRVIGPRR